MKSKPKPRIALLREKAGLTQLELSRLVGVTESTIQNWESGRTGTDHIQRIIKFCKALNCKVEDLIEPQETSPEEATTKLASLQEIHNLLGTDEQLTVNSEQSTVNSEQFSLVRCGLSMKNFHPKGVDSQLVNWSLLAK